MSMERQSFKKENNKSSPWIVVDINTQKDTRETESLSVKDVTKLKSFFEFEISNYRENANTPHSFVPLNIQYFKEHLKKIYTSIVRLENKLSELKRKYETWEINPHITIKEDISRQENLLQSKAYNKYKTKRVDLEMALMDMKIVYDHIQDQILLERSNKKKENIEVYTRALHFINSHFTNIF